MSRLQWKTAGPAGEHLLEAVRTTPGWYWVLRPHQEGPGRYDPSTPVASLVHVFADGRLSSPLADLRSLEPSQIAPVDAKGHRFPSLFAGPVVPGSPSGSLRVERDPDGHRVLGTPPAAPGWYWCRTNSEAPLLHVDADQIGPIYIDRVGDGIHVWSSATLSGRPIDVGELGFSEPLTSDGGVIDASGELDRLSVEFFGAIELPPSPPSPIWPVTAPDEAPTLRLEDGETTLRVADLARARAFYEELGFTVTATRPEEGWASLVGGGLRLRLVTGRGAALHFRGPADTRAALLALNLNPEPSPDGLALIDPDGHRIVIATADSD